MSTTVRTLRGTSYSVTGYKVEDSGRVLLIARQPSGKARYLTRKDVGAARFYAALAHLTRKVPVAA